jgi:hypothetical protein
MTLAVFAFLGLFLGFCGWIVVRAEQDKAKALEGQIAALNGALEISRGREEVLMRTALEARGVAVVDPEGQQKRQLIAAERDAKRRRVATALQVLEDNAARRARDRDEIVRDEIAEMNRLASAKQAQGAE